LSRKHQDAARDCLSARFKRKSTFQAMVGLDRLSDAQKGESFVSLVRLFLFSDGLVDFQEVLKLDPNNQAAKDELTKLTELTKKNC
jgi:hypothetical protein